MQRTLVRISMVPDFIYITVLESAKYGSTLAFPVVVLSASAPLQTVALRTGTYAKTHVGRLLIRLSAFTHIRVNICACVFHFDTIHLHGRNTHACTFPINSTLVPGYSFVVEHTIIVFFLYRRVHCSKKTATTLIAERSPFFKPIEAGQ